MIKIYLPLHTAVKRSKGLCFRISLLLISFLSASIYAHAQCPVVTVSPAVTCGGIAGGGGPCTALTATGNADTYTWSPLAGLYTDCAHTIPYTGGNSTVVYAAPTVYTVYTVTGTILASGCSVSATARVNYTPPAAAVTPNPVVMCLGAPAVKIKAGIPPIATQFCSGPVNIPVPDNDFTGGVSNITVSGLANAPVTRVSITINMTHTKVSDMVIVLRAPNGMILNLCAMLNRTNQAGANFTSTIISSSATMPLGGAAPYTGTFADDAAAPTFVASGNTYPGGPTGYIPTTMQFNSLFSNALAVNGTWTLAFYDGISGEIGTLNSWCINIAQVFGVPAGPAIWTPSAGLFHDPFAVIPYIAGTPVDSVWARPTPAGTYTYQVTTQSMPVVLCSPATNFVNTNGSATVTFNVKNNHPYPIVLSQIDSRTLTASNTSVSAFYKTSAIAGLPGAIAPANGWNQFAAGAISGNGTAVQPFLSNLQLVIPAGTTYGLCLQAVTGANAANLAYSALSPGNYSFNDGGCEIITGTNIGFSGNNIPAAPTNALSGFVGKITFLQAPSYCTSPPTNVVVTVGMPVLITAQPVNQTICTSGLALFSVSATGGGTLSYQWQVSNNGSNYTNIANGGVYSGANSASLTVNLPPVSMSGNYFRVLINGTAACASVTSASAVLTVNPLPVISIIANPLIIGPTQTTTIFSTVTPNPAATYTWYYNNTVIPGAGSSSLLVTHGSPGDYQLRVTDVNGCTDLSNIISIANSFALNLFTYPNPSRGIFQVKYLSEANTVSQRTLVVYNNRGEKVITRQFTQTIPYQRIDVDVRANGKGLYWVELRDAEGKRLGIKRVVVQ
jgi:subtilisin-like proprotein convertase family protein